MFQFLDIINYFILPDVPFPDDHMYIYKKKKKKERIKQHELDYETISDTSLPFVKLMNVGERLIVNHVQGYLQVASYKKNCLFKIYVIIRLVLSIQFFYDNIVANGILSHEFT